MFCYYIYAVIVSVPNGGKSYELTGAFKQGKIIGLSPSTLLFFCSVVLIVFAVVVLIV
jgi:hypothetical protein